MIFTVFQINSQKLDLIKLALYISEGNRSVKDVQDKTSVVAIHISNALLVLFSESYPKLNWRWPQLGRLIMFQSARFPCVIDDIEMRLLGGCYSFLVMAFKRTTLESLPFSDKCFVFTTFFMDKAFNRIEPFGDAFLGTSKVFEIRRFPFLIVL